jgi:fumagillin biosynthesis dioxygenase
MNQSVCLQDFKRSMEENAFYVVPDVLNKAEIVSVRNAVWNAARVQQAPHLEGTDPNARNLRVYNLPNYDRLFLKLLQHPLATEFVEAIIGAGAILSNFSANIALPGSGSMPIHSDQALVTPPPWKEPWTINIAWCLDDISERNGATRYVPGSHKAQSVEDLPERAKNRTVAFEASAGSLIAMEGRLWHTSGANRTTDEERTMIFAYFTRDFIRQQINWNVALSDEAKSWLDEADRHLLGMEAAGNQRPTWWLDRPDFEERFRIEQRP